MLKWAMTRWPGKTMTRAQIKNINVDFPVDMAIICMGAGIVKLMYKIVLFRINIPHIQLLKLKGFRVVQRVAIVSLRTPQ